MVVVCKRNGKNVLDEVKIDLHGWSKTFGYGNVLTTLEMPMNPRMHTATFF